jgi:hypothetical protein
MSSVKKSKQILKNPEFLEALRVYFRDGEGYTQPVVDATIEIFSTLDPSKLSGYSFDTLEDILKFEDKTLAYIFQESIKEYTRAPVSPESQAEFQKIYEIIKKHNAFV